MYLLLLYNSNSPRSFSVADRYNLARGSEVEIHIVGLPLTNGGTGCPTYCVDGTDTVAESWDSAAVVRTQEMVEYCTYASRVSEIIAPIQAYQTAHSLGVPKWVVLSKDMPWYTDLGGHKLLFDNWLREGLMNSFVGVDSLDTDRVTTATKTQLLDDSYVVPRISRIEGRSLDDCFRLIDKSVQSGERRVSGLSALSMLFNGQSLVYYYVGAVNEAITWLRAQGVTTPSVLVSNGEEPALSFLTGSGIGCYSDLSKYSDFNTSKLNAHLEQDSFDLYNECHWVPGGFFYGMWSGSLEPEGLFLRDRADRDRAWTSWSKMDRDDGATVSVGSPSEPGVGGVNQVDRFIELYYDGIDFGTAALYSLPSYYEMDMAVGDPLTVLYKGDPMIWLAQDGITDMEGVGAWKSSDGATTLVWGDGYSSGDTFVANNKGTININAPLTVPCILTNGTTGGATSGGNFQIALNDAAVHDFQVVVNASAGSTTCLLVGTTATASPVTINIYGSPTGGIASSSVAISPVGGQALNVFGNPKGGSAAMCYGVHALNAYANVHIYGIPEGGSNASAYGARNTAGGHLHIVGGAKGGSVALAAGVYNATATAGTCIVEGSLINTAAAPAVAGQVQYVPTPGSYVEYPGVDGGSVQLNGLDRGCTPYKYPPVLP